MCGSCSNRLRHNRAISTSRRYKVDTSDIATSNLINIAYIICSKDRFSKNKYSFIYLNIQPFIVYNSRFFNSKETSEYCLNNDPFSPEPLFTSLQGRQNCYAHLLECLPLKQSQQQLLQPN